MWASKGILQASHTQICLPQPLSAVSPFSQSCFCSTSLPAFPIVHSVTALCKEETGKTEDQSNDGDAKPASKTRKPRRRKVSATAEVVNGHIDVQSPFAGPLLKPMSVKIPVGDRHVTIEAGLIGRQASGSVTITDGETVLLTTVCVSLEASEPSDFIPLSVNYQERYSAAGRTSGGFNKRESRVQDHEILVCRLVDRPIRPTIAKGFHNEVQILCWVLSYDGIHSPEPLAITAAGAALALSDIPVSKIVAGVRVGLIDEAFIINPTKDEMAMSKLDMIVAGTSDAILMIEGYCDFLPEEDLLRAVEAGQSAVVTICKELESFAARVGKPKNMGPIRLPPESLENHIKDIVGDKLEEVLQIQSKQGRTAGIRELEEKLLQKLTEEGAKKERTFIDVDPETPDPEEEVVYSEDEELVIEDGEVDQGEVHVTPVLKQPVTQKYDPADVKLVFKEYSSKVMRNLVVQKGKRSDGRGVSEVRPIQSSCGLLPRVHGSALFTRGETQALSVVTLGGARMGQRIDNITDADALKRFYLQYSFPPVAVGETGRVWAPTRREIGHGILSERALEPALPSETEFPYTVRVESTITESNGSSSMASVCGGCLAMLDAGIPLKSPIAGVAMGLLLDNSSKKPIILTDILGSEDALGDMDLKIAGNETAITAFQMDVKVGGIKMAVLRKAVTQAKKGRIRILAEMAKCQPPPARHLSKHAPLIEFVQVDPEKVNIVIGSGGKTVKGIIDDTGVASIDIEDDGSIRILGKDQECVKFAKDRILNIVKEPEIGTVYRNCPVKAIKSFGCFLEIAPGREGLCHISELHTSKIARVEDVINIGDRVDVKLVEINSKGQLWLSRRALLPKPEKPEHEPKHSRMGQENKSSGKENRPEGRRQGEQQNVQLEGKLEKVQVDGSRPSMKRTNLQTKELDTVQEVNQIVTQN